METDIQILFMIYNKGLRFKTGNYFRTILDRVKIGTFCELLLFGFYECIAWVLCNMA